MTEVLLDSAKPRRLLLAVLLAMAAATVLPATAGADGVWAVGDGAVAGTEDDALAARVQAAGVDRLLYLGDVYERGTASDYRQNYDPSWGRFKAITSPTPGNHEWGNRAVGYDPYWGALAPRTGDGHWYSFNHAGWHFVSLNSEENTSSASAQVAWLRADLARYPGTCTVAFWHRPRYSAGGHPDAPEVQPFWDALAAHAAIVVNGHDHDYQRFSPVRGITQIVVGSGGRRTLDPVNRSDPRLAFADDTHLAALRLRLAGRGATYDLIDGDGVRRDSGSVGCRPHSAPRIRICRRGLAAPIGARLACSVAPRHAREGRSGLPSFAGRGALGRAGCSPGADWRLPPVQRGVRSAWPASGAGPTGCVGCHVATTAPRCASGAGRAAAPRPPSALPFVEAGRRSASKEIAGEPTAARHLRRPPTRTTQVVDRRPRNRPRARPAPTYRSEGYSSTAR